MSQVLGLVWARSRTQADDQLFCSRACRLEAGQASQGRDKGGPGQLFSDISFIKKTEQFNLAGPHTIIVPHGGGTASKSDLQPG